MTEDKPRQAARQSNLPSAEWKFRVPKNPLNPDSVRQPRQRWLQPYFSSQAVQDRLQSRLQCALRKKLPPKCYPVITDAPQPGSCSHHHSDLLSHLKQVHCKMYGEAMMVLKTRGWRKTENFNYKEERKTKKSKS